MIALETCHFAICTKKIVLLDFLVSLGKKIPRDKFFHLLVASAEQCYL
jgi:hypothetical protein